VRKRKRGREEARKRGSEEEQKRRSEDEKKRRKKICVNQCNRPYVDKKNVRESPCLSPLCGKSGYAATETI
jgi:hypothetical protein